jgi:hypothetical protein
MTALEQALKEAWTAGFEEGMERAGSLGVPTDALFEKYMEEVAAKIIAGTAEGESND